MPSPRTGVALTIDAAATIQLVESIAALYSVLVPVYVFRAKLVREWLARPGCRIKLVVSLSNDEPDRAAMGLMHKNVTPNKCHATCGQFADATRNFLPGKVPKNWGSLRDSVTANFRVIPQRIFGFRRERGISQCLLTQRSFSGTCGCA